MNVDPENRLVADSLEADWNEKLRALEEAHRTYEERKQLDGRLVDASLREELFALATDLPRLWNCEQTTDQDHKRMVRLVIEDVTLLRQENLLLQVCFRGGAERQIVLPRPARAWEMYQTAPEAVREIDRLLEDHCEGEIVEILNRSGFNTGHGHKWTRSTVKDVRRRYQLKTRYERLRSRGLLTVEEVAERLNIHHQTVKAWNRHGLLRAHPYTEKNECLYEVPGPDAPRKIKGKRLIDRTPAQPRVSTSQ